MYKVPASKASYKQNRFEFQLPDGRKFSIPKAKYLTTGQVESLASKKEETTITDLLELFGEEEAGKAVRTLDIEQLQALMAGWQEDSGISTGE